MQPVDVAVAVLSLPPLTCAVLPSPLARAVLLSPPITDGHYGALLDGSGAEIASRLDALDAQRERDEEARSGDG